MLNEKPKPNGLNPPKLLEFNGETKSIRQWSKSVGIGEGLIRHRLEKGWTVERALSEKPEPRNKDAAALKEQVNRDVYKVYLEYGQQKFLEWLRAEFDRDAGKAMVNHVYPLLPKEQQQRGDGKKEKAVVRIAFMGGQAATIQAEQ